MVAEKIRQIEFHNPNAIHGFIDQLWRSAFVSKTADYSSDIPKHW